MERVGFSTDSHSNDWDVVNLEEMENTNCNLSFQIHQDDVIRLPKIIEGILVGGHILVMIFSLCGNTAALIIVLKSRAPKLCTKYFLSCLAISDLLMTLSAPSTEVGKLLNDYNAWVFGSLLCVIVPCVQLIAATMSAICLMAIALERNLMVVTSLNTKLDTLSRLWEKWICPLISIAIIVIPVACGLPNIWAYEHVAFVAIPSDEYTSETPDLITTTVKDFNERCDIRYHCLQTSFGEHDFNFIYYIVTGTTYFILVACFLICYISIYLFVRKHGNFGKRRQREARRFSSSTSTAVATPPTPQEEKLLTADKHRRTLRIILGLIFLHICCRFPNWFYLIIMNVFFTQDDENTQPMMILRESLHFLSAINSALNPFLYVIWNHSLRATADKQGESLNSQRGCFRFFRNSNICPRLKIIFYSICCCGRYRKHYMKHSSDSGGHLKTPKIYFIPDSSNNQVPSVSTQKVFISDKSAL